MPTILAMNGAEWDSPVLMGEFGAASQAIADLQSALVTLGKGIGDTVLAKIVIDGLIGPKTTGAVNRAMTVHLGAGQAPANLRTGALSQAQVVAQAGSLTSLITAEIARRGFGAPKAVKPKAVVKKTTTATATYIPPASSASAAAAPTRYTAPAPAASIPSPVYVAPSGGMDMNSIIKWSAIGVGAVALLGGLYYLATKGQGRRPSMAGFGELPSRDIDVLESLVDKQGGIPDVIEGLAQVSYAKGGHLRHSWQDERSAKTWDALGRRLDRFSQSLRKSKTLIHAE